MAIGDDLQILLGMVPIRDRAGIARGTMADAASAAAAKPDGQAPAPMNGARPPAFALPPGMLTGSSPPPADVPLPDDVNAEYTAGSGGGSRMSPVRIDPKVPLPQSSERVIDSSPAAAPSPSVVRHSDILMQAYLQKQRAERVQALFQAIGGMVGAARGEHVSGGGGGGSGGPDMGALKTILDQRQAEDQATELLAQRQRRIQDMIQTQGVSPERARVLVETDEDKKRNDPATLAAAEKVRQASRAFQALEPHLPAYAAAIDMPLEALRELGRNDPQKAIDLVKPDAMQKLTKERFENEKLRRDQGAHDIAIQGIDPQTLVAEPWRLSATASADYFKHQAEDAAKAGPGAAEEVYKQFVAGPHKMAQGAYDYLTAEGKRLGDTWDPNLMTGTRSELRRQVIRAFETVGLGGLADKFPTMSLEQLRKTAAYESALNAYVTDRVRMLPGAASDKEGLFAKAIAGSVNINPTELREVVRMNEMMHRQELIRHDQQIQDISKQSGPLGARFTQLPTYTGDKMPEPSKLLKDDLNVQSPANTQLKTAVQTAYQQYEAAKGTPREQEMAAIKARAAKHFDEQFFPGAADYFAKHPGGR